MPAVKRTVSLPADLDTWAAQEALSLSLVLQNALKTIRARLAQAQREWDRFWQGLGI
jgi:hypothetical protein